MGKLVSAHYACRPHAAAKAGLIEAGVVMAQGRDDGLGKGDKFVLRDVSVRIVY